MRNEANLTWDFGDERTTFPWLKVWLQNASGDSYYILKGPVLPGVEFGQFVETWTASHPNIPAGKYKAALIFYSPLGAKDAGGFDVGELEVK